MAVIVVVMMVVAMMVVMVAVVGTGNRVARQTAENRTADSANRTVRGHTADDGAATGTQNRSGGVVMTTAGIGKCRDCGRAQNN